MSKLTKKEEKEFEELFYWENEQNLLNWLEQKKGLWTEQAYEEGKEDADFNNHVESDLSLD